MSESTTALIIPFPSRAIAPITADISTDPRSQLAPAGLTSTLPLSPLSEAEAYTSGSGALGQGVVEPNAAEARLTRALNGLNNAVTAQRVAMAAWRAALGDLKTVTGRLGASLRNYNESLGNLDARVNTLRNEAVKLEAWADDVLAKKG